MRIQIVDFRDDEAFPPTVSRLVSVESKCCVSITAPNSHASFAFMCFLAKAHEGRGGVVLGRGRASLSGQDVCLFVCVTPSNPHFQTCREVLMRGSEPATCFSTADSD